VRPPRSPLRLATMEPADSLGSSIVRCRAYGSQVPLGLGRATIAGLLFGLVGLALYTFLTYLVPIRWIAVLIGVLGGSQLVSHLLLSCTIEAQVDKVNIQWVSRDRTIRYSNTKVSGAPGSVLLIPDGETPVLLTAPWWSSSKGKQLSDLRKLIEQRIELAA
jgi:hypothetical protein